MWKQDDDFWLSADADTMLVLMGHEDLNITATYGDDMNERPGYITVRVNMFNRAAQVLRVNVTENTTGLQLRSQMLSLRYEDGDVGSICRVRIEGVYF